MTLTRRHLLSCTGLFGLLAAASKAGAFTIERAPAGTAALYLNRCRAQSDHQQLAAEAEKLLSGKSPAEQQAVRAKLAAMLCPVCGCPVLAMLDR